MGWSTSARGPVFALDAATGAERWQTQAGNNCCSMPAVANGTVYVGADDTFVYALDAATGALRWRFQTGGVFLAPVVAHGVAYVASYDGYLYALNA